MYTLLQQTKRTARAAAGLTLAASFAALLLTGCGTGLGTSTSRTGTSALATGTIHGIVHGGQNPVSGASIQLFTVGTSGIASASTNILNTAVVTDANGGFSITGLYPNCTYTASGGGSATATQVYLVATGGNSGSGVNSAIALLAPLGSCSALLAAGNSFNILINEITTVAGVYALAPYMTGYTNVGATGPNPTGLVNAFAIFNQLANVSNGQPSGPALPAGATVPTTEINTLANVIAACINSPSNTSSACTSLFGATAATDTIGAALAFAVNPGSPALTALYSLGGAQAPFVPAFSAAPNDWTLAIRYTAGGSLNAPYGVAIDAGGNAWVTNSGGSSVAELTPSGGTNIFTPAGLVGPKGIAIDRFSNIWIAGSATNSVFELSNTGTSVGSSPFTVGGLNGPVAIAMDSGGNAWIANLTGNSVTELSSTGAALQTSLTAGSTISGPTGIALDSTGNVYVANSGGGNVVKLTHAGAAASGSPLSDFALQGTSAIAVDTSGNVWAPGSTTGTAITGSVSAFSAGAALSYSPLTAGGLALPAGVATTGTSAWVTNGTTAGSLSLLQASHSTPLSPAAGFGSLNAPIGVAVDASGNVWTANSGDGSVSCFVGITTPALTPLSANVGP